LASNLYSLVIRLALVFSVVATSFGVGCDARTDKDAERNHGVVSETTSDRFVESDTSDAPKVLYLPDGGDVAYGSEYATSVSSEAKVANAVARRCPSEMVDVVGSFCIDRYEAQLVDVASKKPLSPYYPPVPSQARKLADYWQREQERASTELGRELMLPDLPSFQLSERVEPMAVATANVVPSGYLDGITAERVCKNAGKRLCTASEWVTACRGEKNRQYPYGGVYVPGACNVFREAHPAQLLHGNASEGHLDPRLNLVASSAGPLLRKTGGTPTCRSEWGNDAVYDLVGNLDEWVEDENGAFQGGFYARSTKLGCDARITSHPRPYKDYSLGVRCCK
jgi:formylglycine-generating enzyme required for sulfatase activity